MTLSKILFVDDDPNLLSSMRRQLRNDYDVVTAEGGKLGVESIRSSGPYSVVVADMNMPEMNGVEVLAAAKNIAPDTIRVMLTGNADQATAVQALNTGQIFRFLNKPCDIGLLKTVLNSSIEQRRLIMSERELLNGTLRGSVKVITDILSILMPKEFGAVLELQKMVRQFCQQLNVESSWEIELASMLSPLGHALLPTSLLSKIDKNEPISKDEEEMIHRAPEVVSKLIGNIPRLEGVAKIIGSLKAGDRNNIRNGKILKICYDYWKHRVSGKSRIVALTKITSHSERYDPLIVSIFKEFESTQNWQSTDTSVIELQIPLKDLSEGQVLISDIRTADGILLVTSGCEITEALRARIFNYSKIYQVAEPILVRTQVFQPN